jgi:hypothetical protein
LERAEASRVLGKRHGLSVLDLRYRHSSHLEFSGALGFSYFRDPAADRSWKTGQDRRFRALIGSQDNRVEVSRETVGGDYRSLGNPRRYQDRRITRASPYLSLTKAWKMYGEFRREDSSVLERTGGQSYRNDYALVGNSLRFSRNSLRLSLSDYDSSLYGRRWSGQADYARAFGRDALDVGGAWASQWNGQRRLYKQSYTGRLGYQWLRASWKLALSEEMTRHYYPWYKLGRWESVTQVSSQWRKWKGLATYSSAPRYFREDTMLQTLFIQLGREVTHEKIINIYAAETRASGGGKEPEVWRAGVSYTQNF